MTIHPSLPLTSRYRPVSRHKSAPGARQAPNGQVRKELTRRYLYFQNLIEQRMATDGWESVKYIDYTVLHSTVADWRYNTAPSELPSRLYFFPASIASPFLHAMIFIFGAVIVSFDSILNDAFFTRNVHTSSHNR